MVRTRGTMMSATCGIKSARSGVSDIGVDTGAGETGVEQWMHTCEMNTMHPAATTVQG